MLRSLPLARSPVRRTEPGAASTTGNVTCGRVQCGCGRGCGCCGDCRAGRGHLSCGAERCRWKDVHHAQALSPEFREDVIRVARNRGPGVHLKDIAADFDISESCLANWLKTADVEDGTRPGTTAAENEDLKAARRRIRLLEQENEVLRRAAAYLGQANLPKADVPARARARRRWDPGRGVVSGTRSWSLRLLPLGRFAVHRRPARRSLARQRDLRRPPR